MARKLSFFIDFQGADSVFKNITDFELKLKNLSKQILNVTRDLDIFKNGNAKQIATLTRAGKSVDSLTKKYNDLRAEETRLTRQQNNLTEELRETSKSFELLGKSVDPTSLRSLELRYRGIRNELEQLGSSARQSAQGLSKINEFKALGAEINSINNSFGQITGKAGSFKAAFSNLLSGTQGLGNFSFSLADIVTGNLISGGIRELANMAVEGTKIVFDLNAKISELKADIRKTTNLSIEDTNTLIQNLENLDTRVSLDGLAEIAVIGGRLGIEGRQGVEDFTKATSKLAIALGDEFTGGIEEVTTRTGKLSNVLFGVTKDGTEMSNRLLAVGNVLNVLAANGQATAGTMTDMANRISALLVPLGATPGQILGLASAMDELAINPERGGSAMIRIIQRIGENLDTISKQLDIPKKELTELFNTDPVEAFRKVAAKTFEVTGNVPDKLINKLKEMKIQGVGNTEIFFKLGQNADLLAKNIDLATESFTNYASIQSEVDKKENTLTGLTERLTNRVKELFIDPSFENFFKEVIKLGGNLLDILTPILFAFGTLFETLTGGVSVGEALVYVMKGLNGVLSGVATIFGFLNNVITKASGGITELINKVPLLNGFFSSLGKVVSFLYDGIANLPVVIEAVGAVIAKLYDNFSKGKFSVEGVEEAFVKAAKDAQSKREFIRRQNEFQLSLDRRDQEAANLAFAELLEEKLLNEEQNSQKSRDKRIREAKKREQEEKERIKKEIDLAKEKYEILRQLEIGELNKLELTRRQFESRLEKINLTYDIFTLTESLKEFNVGSSEYLETLNKIAEEKKKLDDTPVKIKLADVDVAISEMEKLATFAADKVASSEEELQTLLENIKLRADVEYIQARLNIEKLSADDRYKLEKELQDKLKALRGSQAKVDIQFDDRDKAIVDKLNKELTELNDAISLDNIKELEQIKTEIILGAEIERAELRLELLKASGEDTIELEKEISEKRLAYYKATNKEITDGEKSTGKEQKRLLRQMITTYQDVFGDVGEALGEFFGAAKEDQEEFGKKLFKTLLDVVEKIVLLQTVSASAQSFAQPDSVATFGATGALRAGILTALIKGAFALAKSAFLEEGDIIQPENVFSRGGILSGKRHHAGGIKAFVRRRNGTKKPYELEADEAVIKRTSTIKHRGLLSAINEDTGGKQFSPDSYKYKPLLKQLSSNAVLEAGGITSTASVNQLNTGEQGLMFSSLTVNLKQEDIILMANTIANYQSEVLLPALSDIPNKVANGLDKVARRNERYKQAELEAQL